MQNLTAYIEYQYCGSFNILWLGSIDEIKSSVQQCQYIECENDDLWFTFYYFVNI